MIFITIKRYSYETRIILEYSDKTRASFSRKRYDPLLEKVVSLSGELDKKLFNYIEIKNDILKIFYWEQKSKTIVCFLTDLEFLEEIKNKYWVTNVNGYAYTRTQIEDNQHLYLHWLVTDFSREKREKTGLVIDHINHDILDNRKENLRIVTNRENTTNQKNQLDMGVNPTKDGGWRARWSFNGENFQKYFTELNAKERAIKYRRQKMKEYHYLSTFNDYPGRE